VQTKGEKVESGDKYSYWKYGLDVDDGVSVFDITVPGKPRYAILKACSRNYDVDGAVQLDTNGCNILDARTYVKFHYNENELVRSNTMGLLAETDGLPLIEVAALQSLRPDARFGMMPGREHNEDVDVPQLPATPSFEEQKISALIALAMQSDPSDESWTSRADQFPDFAGTVLAELSAHPSLLNQPSGKALICYALQSSTIIDLTPFPDLSASEIFDICCTLTKCGSKSHMTLLLPDFTDTNLIHNIYKARHNKAFDRLHLGVTARGDDVKVFSDFGEIVMHMEPHQIQYPSGLFKTFGVTLDPLINMLSDVKELTHAHLYSRAFDLLNDSSIPGKLQYGLTEYIPSGYQSRLPLTQIIYMTVDKSHSTAARLANGGLAWLKTASALDVRAQPATLNVPLSDALLSLERIAASIPAVLIRMIRTRLGDFKGWDASAIATGIGKQLAIDVRNIPIHAL